VTELEKEQINREEVDERRDIPVDPSDERCIQRIKTWVSRCEEHSSCSTAKLVTLPKRIIEIPSDPTVAPRVCFSNGKVGEYVVLSHCAGDVKVPLVTSFPASLDTETLPKTLADAIAITRKLGYQYLWAASLCIIQDNKTDWDEESSRLATTYGRASLMLSATEGRDSNSGMLHDRHILYSPPLGVNKNRFLRLHLLRWLWDLESSPLGNRGWAGIEKMLAPRIVHFAKHQLIWECAAGTQFEASGIIDKKYGSGQVRQQYQKAVIQPYIEKALLDHPIEVEVVGSDAEIKREVARFEAWHNCVGEFSNRELSVKEDKMPAMTPFARIFDDGTMGEYFAGIWSKNIAFGLAWGRANALLTPAPTYRAPSWSWASVDGGISSMVPAWPENMMLYHAKDPTWLEKYEPKLISQQMILADPAYPYGSVLEGSNIVVSGMCMGLMELIDALRYDKDHGFHLNLGLDQSPMFECSHCIKRPEEERKNAEEEFKAESEHHICMILMGDAWRVGKEYDQHEGVCDLVVLKACEEKGAYERIGFVRIQKETFGNSKTIAEAHEIFDGLQWERKELKLT